MAKPTDKLSVETLIHDEATRKNIPEARSDDRRHRLLVHRYRLQRRKLLRPPRHLLGADDPYNALKAEINEDAWGTPSTATPRARSTNRNRDRLL
jgi:hypothetical protein